MWYFYILAGLFSGIVGGMGMGGGTLLIPILTILLGMPQHTSQGVNLIVFVAMGLVAIIVHLCNHLIDFKAFLWVVVPAILASIGASFLSNILDERALKIVFGVFLILVAIYELVLAIRHTRSTNKPVLKNRL